MGDFDSWTEAVFISIAQQGGSNYEFAAISNSVDIDEGDKPFDTIANTCGGRMIVDKKQDNTIVTLEMYPTSLDVDGEGLAQFFHGNATLDTTQSLEVSSSHRRKLMRVALLMTSDLSIVTGISAVTTDYHARRWVGAGGRLISLKKSFTDGAWKNTAKFEFPPFDKEGDSNVLEESCDNTSSLSAISAYTSSNKFR